MNDLFHLFRLEWEGAIRNGSTCLRTLEEEKLSLLKEMAEKYLHLLSDLLVGPRLNGSVQSLSEPILTGCSVLSDLATVTGCHQGHGDNVENVGDSLQSTMTLGRHHSAGAEQLLPDFYAEDGSNLMNKLRRKEVLKSAM